MQKLDDYDFEPTTKYDWDTILDGSTYRLVPGVDFTCDPKSFDLMTRAQAKSRGGRARVRREKDKAGKITGLVVKFEAGSK